MPLAENENIKPQNLQSGLKGLCGIASFYQITVEPSYIAAELGLQSVDVSSEDLVRGANLIGMRARIIRNLTSDRLKSLPVPALAKRRNGTFCVWGGLTPSGSFRIIDPVTRVDEEKTLDEILAEFNDDVILIQRRLGGAGTDPRRFGFAWIWPSIKRYKRPLIHVLLASAIVQIFALITPLFFRL